MLNKFIANARRINLHLIAIFAMTAFFSPGLSAQDDSFSIRENSLFTDGVNLPASPQAWAMNRYGNESIDLYTGTVGVSLPVYTYSDDDFTIPVSINYSSDVPPLASSDTSHMQCRHDSQSHKGTDPG